MRHNAARRVRTANRWPNVAAIGFGRLSVLRAFYVVERLRHALERMPLVEVTHECALLETIDEIGQRDYALVFG